MFNICILPAYYVKHIMYLWQRHSRQWQTSSNEDYIIYKMHK